MGLEHKSQKVATYRNFSIRMGRYTIFALFIVVFSVLIGTVGYHYLGRLSWLDSFYMSCMILNGVGPVAELTTDTGKVFSSFYALYSGIVFMGVTAVFFTPIFHRLLHILHVEPVEELN